MRILQTWVRFNLQNFTVILAFSAVKLIAILEIIESLNTWVSEA